MKLNQTAACRSGTKHPLLHALRFLVPLGLAMLLWGCATTKVEEIEGFKEKGQTSGNSKGVQASKTRIDAALAPASAQRKERVLWGGVALFKTAESQNQMPFCSALENDLQGILVEALKNAKINSFELNGLGDGVADNWKSKDALVMVVVLSSEQVFTYPSADQTRIDVSVWGEIIFVDTKNGMQVTASYPLSVTVKDIVEGNVPKELIESMFKTALLKLDKNQADRAYAVAGQVVESLENGSAIPRSIRPPIAVSPISIGDACKEPTLLGSTIKMDQTKMADWSDFLARNLTLFLGYNTGFPVNPYAGGDSKVSSEQSLGTVAQLTMRRTDGQQQNVSLRKPVFLFKVQIDSLVADESKLQPQEFGLKKVSYGFKGRFIALNADTGTEMLSVPLDVPGSRQSVPRKELLEKYDNIVTVPIVQKNIENNLIDHAALWKGQINSFLEQLAREIAFKEEDTLKRFAPVRDSIQRNASTWGMGLWDLLATLRASFEDQRNIL